MKLRRCFASHQLLFLVVSCLSAAIVAYSQDKITTRDGKTQELKILSSNGTNVLVKVGAGTVGIPINSITQAFMAPPSEFSAVVAAYDSRNYSKALASAELLAGKYKGLPIDWARQNALMLGDLYVLKNDIAKAEEAYKDFHKFYPGQSTTQMDVCTARLAVAKKDYSAAKQLLEPIAVQALKQKNIQKSEAATYSQVFYLLGRVKEADGDFQSALQAYLLTVTLFYQDHPSVSDAQERADALRKAHIGLVAP